jgi:uncharacterized protein (DUF58 family)
MRLEADQTVDKARTSARAKPKVGRALVPIDWGQISSLRLAARVLAEGLYVGLHRSSRLGSGVEYGGQRPYVPGDDLRFLDRRSLLKHDRLMVRQFETDTDRALWLCLDASDSMGFRSPKALGSKLGYAALLGAGLTRVAIASHDPVGLSWIGPSHLRDVGACTGEIAFERVVAALESAGTAGPLCDEAELVHRSLRWLAQRARRGSIVVLFSDLLDLPEPAMKGIAALGAGARALCVVQVLDPAERDLDFRGKVRLRAIEGDRKVETDADAVRAQYRARLQALNASWARALARDGGKLVRCSTSDDPVAVVREIVRACAEARR